MNYATVKAFDIPGAWYRTLEEIWKNGDDFAVGYGSEITMTRKLNLSIRITNPESRPLVAEKAPCDMKYINSYALQYLWAGLRRRGRPTPTPAGSGSPWTRSSMSSRGMPRSPGTASSPW